MVIQFHTSPYLERYTRVKEYDHEYMVVDKKATTREHEVEDYIDMEYVLGMLGLSTDIFGEVSEVTIEKGTYSTDTSHGDLEVKPLEDGKILIIDKDNRDHRLMAGSDRVVWLSTMGKDKTEHVIKVK